MSQSTKGNRKASKGKRRNAGKVRLEVVHPHAAGIDVGSRMHYASVGGEVRNFGCLTPDLHEMARWLKANDVDTVAMESTGVYWIPVANVLERHGLDVVLVDARRVKNVPGRKSDVQDCEWLRQLHSYGLLAGAFRPDREIQPVRGYWRHRQGLVESCSRQIHLMQKALEQMNLQLHKVLSDIAGLTGLSILRAIVSGERNAVTLARLRQPGVKSSEEEIVKALTGAYRDDQLLVLRQALETYDFLQRQLQDCDLAIERYMQQLDKKTGESPAPNSAKRKRRKNQPYFDLRRCLWEVTGVDLTRIDGIDAMTAQTVIAEAGYDMSPFPTEKHFVSWLGLCPNNRITGGRVVTRRTRKVQNLAAKAFRLAAQSLHRSPSAMGAFLRRMKARHGMAKAITATARKLAILFYRMLKYGMHYIDKGEKAYQERIQAQQILRLQRHAKSMGYQLVAPSTEGMVS